MVIAAARTVHFVKPAPNARLIPGIGSLRVSGCSPDAGDEWQVQRDGEAGTCVPIRSSLRAAAVESGSPPAFPSSRHVRRCRTACRARALAARGPHRRRVPDARLGVAGDAGADRQGGGLPESSGRDRDVQRTLAVQRLSAGALRIGPGPAALSQRARAAALSREARRIVPAVGKLPARQHRLRRLGHRRLGRRAAHSAAGRIQCADRRRRGLPAPRVRALRRAARGGAADRRGGRVPEARSAARGAARRQGAPGARSTRRTRRSPTNWAACARSFPACCARSRTGAGSTSAASASTSSTAMRWARWPADRSHAARKESPWTTSRTGTGFIETKRSDEVSWFRRTSMSRSISSGARRPPATPRSSTSAAGESTLVDDLVADGYRNVDVLDLSPVALDVARHRLGADAPRSTGSAAM